MAREWLEFPEWSETEKQMFEQMAHDTDALNDQLLQALFNTAYFDFDISPQARKAARETLSDYIMDVYGFDFDTWFDWHAWREQYGEAA